MDREERPALIANQTRKGQYEPNRQCARFRNQHVCQTIYGGSASGSEDSSGNAPAGASRESRPEDVLFQPTGLPAAVPSIQGTEIPASQYSVDDSQGGAMPESPGYSPGPPRLYSEVVGGCRFSMKEKPLSAI